MASKFLLDIPEFAVWLYRHHFYVHDKCQERMGIIVKSPRYMGEGYYEYDNPYDIVSISADVIVAHRMGYRKERFGFYDQCR